MRAKAARLADGRVELESKSGSLSPLRVTTGCRALEARGRDAQGETQLIPSAVCSGTQFPHPRRGNDKAR